MAYRLKSTKFYQRVDDRKPGTKPEYRLYRRGDTLENLTEEDERRLLRAGSIVEESEAASEDTEDAGGPEGPDEPSGTLGDPTEGQDDTTEDSEEPQDGTDEFESMSYPELQQAAKDRGLNAGGSGDDLRARLREYESNQ